jgi:hypothetical protein
MTFITHASLLLICEKMLTLCKHVPCNTLTHSTNEDLLNIQHKGDPKSHTLSRTSDTTETWNPYHKVKSSLTLA